MGSYYCSCEIGYFNLTVIAENCSGIIHLYNAHCIDLFSDINECEDNNGGCSQTCINTAGSFNCECYDGYGFIYGSTTDCTGTFYLQKYAILIVTYRY